VPDALADVLADETAEVRYAREDVEAVCELLAGGELAAAESIGRAIVREVLIECCEGSTYYGASLGDGNPQREAAAARALTGACCKVGAVFGVTIKPPLY
jgi:hypothetical protein